MESSSYTPNVCRVCGHNLQEDHRYCPNCGTPTGRTGPIAGISGDVAASTESHSDADPDPSILETRRFVTQPEPQRQAESQWTSPAEQVPPTRSDVPLWGTPETTVAPERGNRTLWIILGIIAFIVLVCCCLLPLGLAFVTNLDMDFQREIRSGALFTVL